MKPPLPLWFLLALPLWSCASTSLVVDGRTGQPTTLEALADDLAGRDVVFIGEAHDNRIGHRLELALVRLLHARRPDLIVSMEMFERDVQNTLDRYLEGELTEEQFLTKARPWKTYRSDYRPIVEYAKDHGLAVLAANLPRQLAHKVASEGLAAAQGHEHAARKTSAPRDAYWEAFKGAMKEHGGVADETTLYRFYQSQCLKDDTMAESIAGAFQEARAQRRRPLVVHLCGSFHSDHSRGTVSRLQGRLPDASIGVVSMDASKVVKLPEPVADPAGDYLLVVRAEPEKASSKPEKEPPTKTPKAEPTPEPAEPDPGVRPALGFMPDYGDQEGGGVGVAQVIEDGPAERGGMEDGDLIVELDGKEIADLQGYVAVLRRLQPGSRVRVVVRRDGKRVPLEVVVGTR